MAAQSLAEMRLDRAFNEAANGLGEPGKLADLWIRLDLTVRFHAANGRPSTTLRLTGRAAPPTGRPDALPAADTPLRRTPRGGDP
ncbi:hypothetical protein [Streptomyces sp. NPDC048340]|uniref:hypothetical protein n=1 Tax=Streptomyces sp. NPDC048340 TaxID=3365537 RepID=UPI0037197B00